MRYNFTKMNKYMSYDNINTLWYLYTKLNISYNIENNKK
jgi:hypothetical protein